jgi:uncharacterized SAM-binding protein YcdF (DUF218 family)
MSFTPFSFVLESIAFPPGNVLLLGVAALMLRRGRWLVATTALLLLYLQSAPVTVAAFTAPLERYPPLDLERLPSADAIVVLGGGRYSNAPEYGRDSASDFTLERLQYAADLERATGLPLVLSGGSVQGEPVAEATIMADLLRNTFGLTAEILTETQSRNTAENAIYTKQVLEQHGWQRVFLVTRARDMPRAMRVFERNGTSPIAAPLRFDTQRDDGAGLLADWLPSARAMYQFREACHEYVGALWYLVRY